MTIGLRWLGVAVALCCHAAVAAAQDTTAARDTAPRHPAGHFHVGLTIHDVGLSFGNAPRVIGLRVNVQDAELERVDGVNLTFWKPREPFSGTVNGLQVGILPGSVPFRTVRSTESPWAASGWSRMGRYGESQSAGWVRCRTETWTVSWSAV